MKLISYNDSCTLWADSENRVARIESISESSVSPLGDSLFPVRVSYHDKLEILRFDLNGKPHNRDVAYLVKKISKEEYPEYYL